jgi:prepilin-type N-terminal cleavage/methylation domain-containing protein
MKKVSGFTLVEILISISILSLLLFTGSYVYSSLSTNWGKELGQFNHNFAELKSIVWLQRLVNGIMPFVIVDADKSPIVPTLFFVGGSDNVLGLTKVGLLQSEFPVIFRISSVVNENNKLDLVYQSISTKDIVLVDTQQSINFVNKITLLSDLDSISFRYYGWENLFSKTLGLDNQSAKRQLWYMDYSGIDRKLLPEKIEVKISKNKKSLIFYSNLNVDAQKTLFEYLEGVDNI